MNITQIEEVVKKLASDIVANQVNKDEFIYQLMAAYGHRKTTIGRIKSGERNLAKVDGEVRAKRHIYFKQSQSNCVLSDIDNMKKEPSVARDKIRFVIATDFNQFVALDTRTHDTLDIEFTELGKHFDFFLPWAGMEKAVYQGENPADVKAAEKMAKLFDLIKADNFNEESKNDTAALHNLNVFLTRLLFCFFAEDTGIFKQNQFSAALESHTKVDGADVDNYLNRLFDVLNTSKESRGDLPEYLASFEYVNGGLFANTIASPRFSTKSRKMLIECGSELDWSDINPDIFGSMIQAVVHPDQRGGMGMHYTSVTNIMKVIEPLFLDELYAEFENIEDNIDAKLKPSRLRKLHDRIAEIKIFDPACGSGNFLIIAFKELRKLEMEIIKRLQELDQNEKQDDLFGDVGLDSSFSRIKLSQFYGIELDDFAHEVAILSLWLAEHQMNVEFKAEFGECEPTLPLQNGGHIIAGNAVTTDWSQVVSFREDCEVFIIGNPPYLGSNQQTKEQKQELLECFNNEKGVRNLDYVCCWLYKASVFINQYSRIRAAFVTTNSITQGEQVPILWPRVFSFNVEIGFACKSFKWANNAKDKAAVTCVIIGLRNISKAHKRLISNDFDTKVVNINPYLIDYENLIVEKRRKQISSIMPMLFGSKLVDGGHLILTNEEKLTITNSYPWAEKYIKRLFGADEYVKGNVRWCLWIKDSEVSKATEVPEIKDRLEKVRNFRLKSTKKATQDSASSPHLFGEIRHTESNSIIVPRLGSERREYILAGFLDGESVILDRAQAIPNATLFEFAIVSSKMHMAWASIVCGRFKTDINYSSSLCYNTFPLPEVTTKQREEIESAALNVLSARESFPDKTIAELYDPDKMPELLKSAHENLDSFIEKLYSENKLSNDESRIVNLLALYKKMTGGQNA